MKAQKLSLAILVLFGLFSLPFQTPVRAHPARTLNEVDAQDAIIFTDLGLQRDLFLQGPLSRTTLAFSYPPEWRLEAGARLQLDVTILLSNFLVGQETRSLDGVFAGQVSVVFNRVPLGAQLLQGGGQRILDFEIPAEALIPDPATGLNELVIEWDSTASCGQNLAASLSLSVDTSYLLLPHQMQSPALNLGLYPRPFVTGNNPRPAPVTLGIPDQSAESTLRGVIAIAASLGRLSGGQLDLALVSASQLTRANFADSHLILLGQPQDFALAGTSSMPVPISAQDGVLALAVSPWNSNRVILWVSGADGPAVEKAALALAGGALVTAGNPATAFVGAATVPQPAAFQRDQPFSTLTPGPLTFTTFGMSRKQVQFHIPPGSTVGADAYVDLTFTHAQLIDFLRSGIVVRLNGITIGSIRLSDVSSNLNTARLIIPASAVRSGVNTLELQVEITPRDACSDWRTGSQFVTIFPESVLHLPLSDTPILPQRTADLSAFPAAFLQSDLDNTTFILPENDPASWAVAARLAFALGAQSLSRHAPGVQIVPDAGAFTPEGGDYIVVGQPGRAPAILAISGVLPAPFDANGQISPETAAQFPFAIDPSRSAGFLQAAVLSGGATSVLLVAGNNSQGLDWASQSITDPSLREKMQGSNFVAVQSRGAPKAFRVNSPGSDTTPGALIPGVPEQAGGPETDQSSSAASLPRSDAWALPTLAVAILAMIALLVMEVRSWRN